MTRREIFLQADPHTVTDSFCRRFIPYRTGQAFHICKGLKCFARGEKYSEPEEVALAKIINSGKKFKLTHTQAHVILTGFKGLLGTALDALGFKDVSNPDELVNKWLDQTEPGSIGDANQSATNIISKLIHEHNERFQS